MIFKGFYTDAIVFKLQKIACILNVVLSWYMLQAVLLKGCDEVTKDQK